MKATQDELLALQMNCGSFNVPTQLTYEYRLAVSGEGPRAADWADKPHRLVYDLCSEIERLTATGVIPGGYGDYTPVTVRSSTTVRPHLVDDPNSASGKRIDHVEVSLLADLPPTSFPATISDDDIECASIAWMWSSSRADNRLRQSGDKGKVPSSPEALWDVVPMEQKASIREHIKAALQAVLERSRSTIAAISNASEDDKVDHLMSRIGDVLFCCDGITNGALKDIELIVRDSIRRNPRHEDSSKEDPDWIMPSELKDDEVALLAHFGNAYKSGAQGANMDADTAQVLAQAVLKLSKLVDASG